VTTSATTGPSSLPQAHTDGDLALAAKIARVTDLGMIDPIVGMFIPGLGDIVTSAVGLYLVVVAWRKRLPKVVLARMLLNLGIDTAVGLVPLVGDVFDFAWQANRRNLALLQARHVDRRSRPGDWAFVLGAALLLVAALALPIALVAYAIHRVGW
jgi:hypothetical protein